MRCKDLFLISVIFRLNPIGYLRICDHDLCFRVGQGHSLLEKYTLRATRRAIKEVHKAIASFLL